MEEGVGEDVLGMEEGVGEDVLGIGEEGVGEHGGGGCRV